MNLTNIQITSATALSFATSLTAPVCVFHGRYADLALDLMRELIGDCGAQNDPDRIDDGRFIIHADVEMDGKNYSVCYIRNADFMGDNRLAVNFEPNSIRFSEDDTREFVDKCNEDDHGPIFVYEYLDRLDHAIDVSPVLDTLSSLGRQVFMAVCPNYPIEKLKHDAVQIVHTEADNVKD